MKRRRLKDEEGWDGGDADAELKGTTAKGWIINRLINNDYIILYYIILI